MFYLIIGGSGSGKSAYAEHLVEQIAGREHRVYLATMQVSGEEGKHRVMRHRRLRADKSFRTVEQAKNLPELNGTWDGADTVLLECMSNLAANEMFQENDILKEDAVVKKVVADVLSLKKQVCHLVVVSNNIFEDGICYDDGTRAYIRALGRINGALFREADVVTEVVYTVPVTWKGE